MEEKRHAPQTSHPKTVNSATSYPLVQLRRGDNEQVRWLRPDPTTGFSDTTFTSAPTPSDFPLGHALVIVFVNGIPSISEIILVHTGAGEVYLPLIKRDSP
jgi:hypothetical protein